MLCGDSRTEITENETCLFTSVLGHIGHVDNTSEDGFLAVHREVWLYRAQHTCL